MVKCCDRNLPDKISEVLLVEDKDTYPNIFVALKILGTVSINTCECERSISLLRGLKTYLRSTMTKERMNGLALLYIHRDVKIHRVDLINKFARKHPRRMEMLDIFEPSKNHFR